GAAPGRMGADAAHPGGRRGSRRRPAPGRRDVRRRAGALRRRVGVGLAPGRRAHRRGGGAAGGSPLMGDVVMPRLSDTMEEGTIIEWLAGEGEAVAAGDDLLEVQTDKAAATYAAEEAGVLRIREPAGRTVPVGTVIAELA